MKIFAVSDLHLSNAQNKPMDIFGKNWENYIEKIKKSWNDKVGEDDIVLLGGDLSWAMKLENALPDIFELSALPGKKIIIKGNHDYWWNSISKLRKELPPNVYALQNDCVKFENVIICGSRCWSTPGSSDFKIADKVIYLREAQRLEMSLAAAKKLQTNNEKIIGLVHFPPFNTKLEDNLLTALFDKYEVTTVVYGHIHANNFYDLVTEKNGIKYYLTSCDMIGNQLALIYNDN